MTNLVITSTANSIKVDFNDSPIGDIQKGVWNKEGIFHFVLLSDRVQVLTTHGDFEVAYTATNGCLIVDSVNGVAPTSLADLYAKLSALIA